MVNLVKPNIKLIFMSNYKSSIYLTSLLRHRAINDGFHMDSRGFVAVSEIMTKCNNFTLEKIKQIVAADKKSRFHLEERNGEYYIRAAQGHTIPGIDPDLKLIVDPSELSTVVHGTYLEAYESIKLTGLNKMDRNHIHFAHGTINDPTVISGMRKTANVMIYIDVEAAMDAGINFYVSANGVILSDGINGVIDPKFFSKVEFT